MVNFLLLLLLRWSLSTFTHSLTWLGMCDFWDFHSRTSPTFQFHSNIIRRRQASYFHSDWMDGGPPGKMDRTHVMWDWVECKWSRCHSFSSIYLRYLWLAGRPAAAAAATLFVVIVVRSTLAVQPFSFPLCKWIKAEEKGKRRLTFLKYIYNNVREAVCMHACFLACFGKEKRHIWLCHGLKWCAEENWWPLLCQCQWR